MCQFDDVLSSYDRKCTNKTLNIASLIPNFIPSDPEWEFPSHYLSMDGNGKIFDPMGIPTYGNSCGNGMGMGI